ncbi:MAG: hypothetical protein HYV09_05830 [Deltaproteobacteria bacterium]|nr:hypothetical protein [Deltaproteobacteria bacterium]
MRALLVVLLLLGCTRRDAAKIGPVAEGAADGKPAPTGLAEVRTRQDITRLDGQRAIVVGRYDVELVSAHKKGGRLTSIVLADGTHVYRAYGPIKAELGFVNRHVRATGKITSGPPDPMMQSVGGPHVALEHLELEEGGQPPPASTLPTPPLASTEAELLPHSGRWIALHGAVDTITVTSAPWATVAVRLSDGKRVYVESAYEPEWTPLVGKAVTAIGVIRKDDAAHALMLGGSGSPCVGREPRCGMDGA